MLLGKGDSIPVGGIPPLVGSNGLEPSTSRLSGVRSNHLSYEPISVAVRGLAMYRPTCVFGFVRRSSLRCRPPLVTATLVAVLFRHEVLPAPAGGGDEQNRTVDPLLARQVLSQLSYAPV